MGDQDHEKVDCSVCNASGITWQRRKPRLCSFCEGARQLTPDELASRLNRLAGEVSSLPGAVHDELDRFQKAVGEQAIDAEELERQFLLERGIKAKPGIEEQHLLPYQGGELSEEQEELQAILKAGEERRARRAAAISQLDEQARHDEELKERYGPDLYRLYRSGRISEAKAHLLVGPEDLTLFQQCVDQGNLAMVDVGYDCQVTDIAVLMVTQIHCLQMRSYIRGWVCNFSPLVIKWRFRYDTSTH